MTSGPKPRAAAASSVARSSAGSTSKTMSPSASVAAGGAHRAEIEQRAVQQVRRGDLGERAEDGVDASRVFLLPLAQHRGDLPALQMLLRAAQIARNDREGVLLREPREVPLAHVRQRPDDDVPAVVGDELGRHGLQLAAEEEIEEERREEVVAVVAQRDLGRADLRRDAIDRAAAQARAQRAQGAAVGNDALDDAVGVLLDDAERDAARFEVAGEHVGGKAGLLLVEVHRDHLEREGRAPLETQQDVEQAVAVLAAGHADHDPVVRRDQPVVPDRLADLPAQALPELVGLELGLPRVAAGRAGPAAPAAGDACGVSVAAVSSMGSAHSTGGHRYWR